MDKRDFMKTYKCLLVDDTKTDKAAESQMIELAIKCGSKWKWRLRGQIKCIHNQCVTIHIFTLQHLLKNTMHLLVCQVFQDVGS